MCEILRQKATIFIQNPDFTVLWFADESGDNQKATELPQLTLFEQDHPHHVDPNPLDHHGGGLGGRGGGGAGGQGDPGGGHLGGPGGGGEGEEGGGRP